MKWEPLPLADTCTGIDGTPVAEVAYLAAARSFSGESVDVGYWRCTSGRFVWSYGVDETIVIISGNAIINGVLCSAGSVASFKRGSKASWDVLDTVTKLYVIQRPAPRWRRLLRKLKHLFDGEVNPCG